MPDSSSELLAPTLSPLREVIARHKLSARKSLGQNFLLDMNLTHRIARQGGDLSTGTVIEIGPGPGGLTRALLAEGARHVIAIERDERCLAALDELAQAFPGRLTLINDDALTLDLKTLGTERPWRIIANLPYNIATALLLKWLEGGIDSYECLVLMFQKEVAERIGAKPGGKSYGRLSVMAQWLCTVEMLFDINPSAFTPAPKVTSRLIALHPRSEPLAPAKADILKHVVKTAFSQRRKMLRSALKGLDVDVAVLLESAGIKPTDRAETLDVESFCRFARVYESLKQAAPPATAPDKAL